MTLWSFPLAFADGRTIEQVALAEGASEAEAADAVAPALADHPGVVLVRPGTEAADDVETRWREILPEPAFPQVVATSGRLARYAWRGSPGTH